jgi:transcriptional regulator with XRE-family HTH domain
MFPNVGTFDLIGETLRRLRREKGLTLEELGKAAKLGRGQLSRIENSHQKATLSSLGKLLVSLGVSRQEFFRRYDQIEAEKRREAGEVAAEENWPEQVREVVSKVESFVQMTFGQPRPVAQGAVEVGDWMVLFRVMPKSVEGPAPAAPSMKPEMKSEEEAAVRPKARKRPVGRPRKG